MNADPDPWTQMNVDPDPHLWNSVKVTLIGQETVKLSSPLLLCIEKIKKSGIEAI